MLYMGAHTRVGQCCNMGAHTRVDQCCNMGAYKHTRVDQWISVTWQCIQEWISVVTWECIQEWISAVTCSAYKSGSVL